MTCDSCLVPVNSSFARLNRKWFIEGLTHVLCDLTRKVMCIDGVLPCCVIPEDNLHGLVHLSTYERTHDTQMLVPVTTLLRSRKCLVGVLYETNLLVLSADVGGAFFHEVISFTKFTQEVLAQGIQKNDKLTMNSTSSNTCLKTLRR